MISARLTFKKTSLFVIFLIFSTIGYAQQRNPHIDSLNNILGQTADLDLALNLEKVIQKEARASHYYFGILDGTIKIVMKLQDAGRYGLMLKKLDEIEDVLVKHGSDDDKYCVYYLRGVVYSKIGFYDQANIFYDKAMIYAVKERDINQRHYQLGEVFLAKALNFRDSKIAPSDTVKYYLLKNLNQKRQIDKNVVFHDGLVSAGFYLCQFYIKLNQLDSAKKYLDVALEVKLQPGARHASRITDSYYFQGMFYLAKGEAQKSLTFLNKAIERAHTFKASYRIRDISLKLSEAYAVTHNSAEEKKWLKEYTRTNDSITRVEKQTTNNALEYLKPEVEKDKKTSGSNNTLLWGILFGALMIVGVVVFYIRKSKKVQTPDTGLPEKIRVWSEDQNAPEKRIEELKQVTEMAMSNDPAFFTKYNEYDPSFRENLLKIAPGITASDLEFCAYIKLNFDTKEIARYSKLSVRAVESKKSRLRKKLDISSGADLNLWMSKL